jgi:hypothetical protein
LLIYKGFKAKNRRREKRKRLKRLIYKGALYKMLLKIGLRKFKN